MTHSQPPPRAMPRGATTTGPVQYFIFMWASWMPLTAASMPAQSLFMASMATRPTLAPTEKLVASLPTTRPASSPVLTRSQASSSIPMIRASMEFILVWNSTQPTPSPMS